MTLAQLIAQTERRLRAARLFYGHGTDNARDEAAFLVLRGLGLPFDADLGQEADPRRIEPLVKRRIEERTPAAYLLKEAWLAGVPFYVDRRVIVPRSHLAELIAARFAPWQRGPLRRILDLCTGSGCLAVLAARAFPLALVDAADLSTAAIAVARRNVARHGLEKRVRLLRSDLFASTGRARYDLIITNPPYVPTSQMRALPAEYRHEPGLALAAGRDGLDLVRRILAEAPRHLSRRGVLVCEVGDRRNALQRAYPGMPFVWVRDEVFLLEAAILAARPAPAATRRAAAR